MQLPPTYTVQEILALLPCLGTVELNILREVLEAETGRYNEKELKLVSAILLLFDKIAFQKEQVVRSISLQEKIIGLLSRLKSLQ